jgi:lipopolysaccharide export system protein LptA
LKNLAYLFIFIILEFLSFSKFQVFAQERQPILLKNADSLLGITFDNAQVRNFIGHVMFVQGNIVLTCDTAIQYINENRVELIGKVQINQNYTTIKSPKINYTGNNKIAVAQDSIEIQDTANILRAKTGEYNFETKIAHFKKNVSIENDSVQIYSDELINNTESNESFSTGFVRVFGKKNRTATVCDTLIYKPNQSFLLAYGNAGFFYIDSVKQNKDTTLHETLTDLSDVRFDTLSVFSNTIFGNQVKGQEFYQFLDSVEIVRGTMSARCKRADYFKTGDSILLTGAPIVWFDNMQLTGDTIFVLFPYQTIQKVKLLGNAFALSFNDSLGVDKINQISGKYIDIFFEKDSVKSILSKIEASSVYFIKSDDGESGVQRSGADSISISFEQGNVSNISWKSAAFIDYYPEKIVANPKEFYLPKFNKRDDKPKKRIFPSKQ